MATSIPLSCNICPKKPKFSDVSHLLTHIASKGHLSHYYKVKVRSGTDPTARQLIETYDQWYGEWNVEDLMCERMNLKDNKKRPRTRNSVANRASSVANSNNAATISRARPAVNRQNSTARSARLSPALNTLDPRLVDSSVKNEPKATPPLHAMEASMMHRMRRNYSLQNPYPGLRGKPMPTIHSDVYGSAAGRRDSLFEDSKRPETLRAYTYPEPPRQSPYADQVTLGSSSPINPPSTSIRSETPEQQDVDNSRLKGVLWPGMSIFDSATPAARRRRNQKKDASILEQLEASSLEVEPTEAVWMPDGELKKERVITGNPHSSSSPFRPSPTPTTTNDNDRLPLKEVPIRKPYFGRGQLDNRRYDTYADELAEARLTYPTLGKRKRPFQVYKDHDSNPEDEEKVDRRASLARPAPMTYLTRGLDKENGQQVREVPMTHEQTDFLPAYNDSLFEPQSTIRDDEQQYYANMGDYHQQNHNNRLFRLADAAATSAPFPTSADMSIGYSTANANPCGLAYPPHFLQHSQISAMQQCQYQMPHQHSAVHANSQLRTLSATAGLMQAHSLSNGMQNFGLSLQQHLHGYDLYGHDHHYQSIDQPFVFSQNSVGAFSANNWMYDHSSCSGMGNNFDHPTPAPMSGSLATSPAQMEDYDGASASPEVQKMDEKDIVNHGHEIDGLPIDDNPSDKYSCGQMEVSDDEGRTITAPATPSP